MEMHEIKDFVRSIMVGFTLASVIEIIFVFGQFTTL